MSIEKLPIGCFPKPTKCLVTAGIYSDVLKIEDGDSLDKIVSTLIETVSCLKEEKCDPCNECNDNTNLSNLDTTTGVGNLITAGSLRTYRINIPFTIKVSSSTNNKINLEYNFRDALQTQNCSSSSISVKISNESKVLHTGVGTSGRVSLNLEDFPNRFSIEISCYNQGKQTELKFSKIIPLGFNVYEEYLTSNTVGVNIENQVQANEHFDSCISDLKTRVSSLESLDITSNTSNLLGLISANEDSITDTKQSLEIEIENLKTSLSTLTDENLVLSQEINRLSQQYQTLYTLLIGNG